MVGQWIQNQDPNNLVDYGIGILILALLLLGWAMPYALPAWKLKAYITAAFMFFEMRP